MAFENLSERLQNAIKMFRGSGKITEDDLKAPLREVRMALLEADVNFKSLKILLPISKNARWAKQFSKA